MKRFPIYIKNIKLWNSFLQVSTRKRNACCLYISENNLFSFLKTMFVSNWNRISFCLFTSLPPASPSFPPQTPPMLHFKAGKPLCLWLLLWHTCMYVCIYMHTYICMRQWINKITQSGKGRFGRSRGQMWSKMLYKILKKYFSI